MRTSVLVIDDNVKVCDSLKQNFERVGYACVTAANGDQALGHVREAEPSVIILDLKLKDTSGIRVLQGIKDIAPTAAVIILTGFGTIQTAVEAMKLGAYDYLQKPVNFARLQKAVQTVAEAHSTTQASPSHDRQEDGLPSFIVTRNGRMREALDRIAKVATTNMPVLITGESGTGKELFAEYVHSMSVRRTRTLEKVNCAAFPEALLDNELFGHERGAYTGADGRFEGVFERADGGTLFLDEIGDMALSIQSKILRALQNQEVRRLGGTKSIHIDVRFIAATNRDLSRLIAEAKFREDLFYRLNAAMIRIPPLRERLEDIESLIALFLKEAAVQHNKTSDSISSEAMKALHEHSWPGNVRELKNVVNYACTVADGHQISTTDLPPYLADKPNAAEPVTPKARLERTMIQNALEQTAYNKKKAAELLGISRKTLYNKLQRYEISTG